MVIRFLRRLGQGKLAARYYTCVLDEQTWDGLRFLKTLGELLSGAVGHSCGGSAPG